MIDFCMVNDFGKRIYYVTHSRDLEIFFNSRLCCVFYGMMNLIPRCKSLRDYYISQLEATSSLRD